MGIPAIPPGPDFYARNAYLREGVITLIGQSNEHGNVPLGDTAYPQAYASLLEPSVRCPIAPSVNPNGGYLCGMRDELAAVGLRPTLVNAAVPSLTFLAQTSGLVQPLQRNTSYSMQRPASGEGDLGDVGDYVLYSGKVFQCTTGRVRGAFFSSMSTVNPTGGGAFQTGIAITGAQVTAGTQPAAFDTAAIGDTVVDGTCAFTRVNEALYTSATTNLNVMTRAGQPGRGHDPLSVIYRASREARRMARGTYNLAIIMNGQSDLGSGGSARAPTYSRAVQSIGESCLRQGFSDVMLGLTNWSPGSSGATTTAYDNLSNGVDDAVTALAALYPGRVTAGPNLYRLMGSTGPMASGGAFLQNDNVHLNGAGCVGPAVSGVSSAKVHMANVVAAWARGKGIIG